MSDPQIKRRLLRVKEVCQILGMDRLTIYKMINKGEIEAINIHEGEKAAKRYRVLVESIDKYVRERQKPREETSQESVS